MAETKSTGRHILKDSDFVVVEDGDGNDVYSVPKHWEKDVIPDGLKKTNRKAGGASTSRASAPSGDDDKKVEEAVEKAVAAAKADAEKADAASKAEIERLTKELAEAKASTTK